MWSFGNSLVATAILCTCVQAVDVRTFTRDWITGPSEILMLRSTEDITRSDNKFAYASCIPTGSPEQLDCDVKVETLFESSSSTQAKVCHLKLSARASGLLHPDYSGIMWFDLLGNDKVLISVMELYHEDFVNGNLTVNVVDMNKCSNVQIVFPHFNDQNTDRHQVIPYADTFDVITVDKESCSGGDACRLTFNQEGKRIAGPVSFPLNTTKMWAHPVRESSADEGLYVMGYTFRPHKLLLTRLDLNGTTRHLMEVENLEPYVALAASSSNHGCYGVCWVEHFEGSNEVRCVQFGGRNTKALINVTLSFDEKVVPVAVHNSLDGLLVVTMKNNESKCDSFEVTRILANGHKGSLKVDGLDVKCSQTGVRFVVGVHFAVGVMDAGKEFCFNFVNSESIYEDDEFVNSFMKYRRKCVSKRDINAI